MSASYDLDLPAFLELLQRVLPDGLEHPVTHDSFVTPPGHDQRLFYESGEKIQDVLLLDAPSRTHRL